MTEPIAVVRMDLTKEAKNKGGDRYDGVVGTTAFNIYIPQEISRAQGRLIQSFDLALTPRKG